MAVFLLLSGPLIATACRHCLASGWAAAPAATDSQQQQGAGEGSRTHEDWMDILRLSCILFMVVRHAIQSLERLWRVPSVDLSFFLHGLPLFMYVAGRSFGVSVSTKGVAIADYGRGGGLKARFLDHLAFCKRRTMQLLLPSIIGTALVVIPTEYVGRKWRHCAKGPDAPLAWLQVYLFGSTGLRCEGFGWLGFMISLFVLQAVLRPWALALHRRISSPAEPPSGVDLAWVVLWISGGIALGSLGLPADSPIGVRGFLRPETALTVAPAIADLLSLSIRLPGRGGKGEWQAAPAVTTHTSLRLPALVRRIVASVALAAWTKKMAYDDLRDGDSANKNCLWIEMCSMMLFYQQGVADGIFRSTPGIKDAVCTSSFWNQLRRPLAAFETYLEKVKAERPRLGELIASVVAWGLFLLVALIPIYSHAVVDPGYRYPAYYRNGAGSFVLRSWATLALAIWWWGGHLPKALMCLKTVAPLGFTLYVLHWFFIELVFGQIYPQRHIPMPGELPWWVALVIALVVCALAVTVCHGAIKAATGNGLSWKWLKDELVIRIKTGDVRH